MALQLSIAAGLFFDVFYNEFLTGRVGLVVSFNFKPDVFFM